MAPGAAAAAGTGVGVEANNNNNNDDMDSTPLARNQQNKLTELLRDKVVELEAAMEEREARDRELAELRERCSTLARTLTLAEAPG